MIRETESHRVPIASTVTLTPMSKEERLYVNDFLSQINDIESMNLRLQLSLQQKSKETEEYQSKLIDSANKVSPDLDDILQGNPLNVDVK